MATNRKSYSVSGGGPRVDRFGLDHLPLAQFNRPLFGLRPGLYRDAEQSGACLDAPESLPAGSMVSCQTVIYERAAFRGRESRGF